jgi:hypothetical protein
LVKARKNEGLPYDDVEEYTDLTNPQLMIFRSNHLGNMRKKLGLGDSTTGEYFPLEDFIYINPNLEYEIPADETLMHELDHRYRMSTNLWPYTIKELDLLDSAYNYKYFNDSQDTDLKDVYDSGPFEKSSVNRELRYIIYKKTGLVGKELDNYIDNMSDDDLLDLYYDDISYPSYLDNEKEERENGTLDIKSKSKAVRDALKYVGYNDTYQSPFNF